VDAIVNAANTSLTPGSGVCGAIHAAAGPELEDACRALGGCPTGDARITPGFRLRNARHVIHAVGPIWRGGSQGEDRLLASCYSKSLELASEHRLHSIAFPSISTGVYGYPLERASRVAVSTVLDYLAEHELPSLVILVAYGDHAYAVLDRTLREAMMERHDSASLVEHK